MHTRARVETIEEFRPGSVRWSPAPPSATHQLSILRRKTRNCFLLLSSCQPYREKISGARADRPQPGQADGVAQARRCRRRPKLDRLVRSTRQLLNLIHAIGEAGRLSDQSATLTLCGVQVRQGRLLATLLAGIADFDARPDQGADRRWLQARNGARRQVWPQVMGQLGGGPRLLRCPVKLLGAFLVRSFGWRLVVPAGEQVGCSRAGKRLTNTATDLVRDDFPN